MSRSTALVVMSTVFWACQGDVAVATDSPSEHGRWVVNSATRGGRPTNTLDAAYFEFDTASSTLKPNFTGQEEPLAYTADEAGFATPEGELFQHIDVSSISDTIIDLSTDIQGTKFTFRLRPDAAGAEAEVEPIISDSLTAPLDDDPGEGI